MWRKRRNGPLDGEPYRMVKKARALPAPTRPSVTPFVLDALKDGMEWTTERLKAKAIQDFAPWY